MQWLNGSVFPDLEAVAQNIAVVSAHLRRAAERRGEDLGRRALEVLPARDGSSWIPLERSLDQPPAGLRLLRYIEGSRAVAEARSIEDVREVGLTVARFQADLEELSVDELAETLPGFHDTPSRFDALERSAARDPLGRLAECRDVLDAYRTRRESAGRLLEAAERGDIPWRVVHNDAKIANVLFDETSGEGLCMIDFDTVMPGLRLWDYGEMVRSMASRVPEDGRGPEGQRLEVTIEAQRLDVLRDAYLEVLGDLLTPTEHIMLEHAGELLTAENGVRFLADHIEGDPYYPVSRPGHNLDRARTQLALLEALERYRLGRRKGRR